MNEQDLIDGMEALANEDLSVALALATSIFVSLTCHYVEQLKGAPEADIVLQGEHRNITIHALKQPAAVEPGFVVYIKDQDDPELWERSKELPDIYPNEEMANLVIEAFCKQADDETFNYVIGDFKVVEQFIPQGDEDDERGDQTSQQD